jgi:hypothetical protein
MCKFGALTPVAHASAEEAETWLHAVSVAWNEGANAGRNTARPGCRVALVVVTGRIPRACRSSEWRGAKSMVMGAWCTSWRGGQL